MAVIDYGALAFCNGRQIHGDKLFPIVRIGLLDFEFCKTNCAVIYKSPYTGDTMVMCRFSGANCQFEGNGLLSPWYERGKKSQRHCWAIPAVCVGVGEDTGRDIWLAIHIKELCDGVFRFRALFNGDHYTVIYGLGIDNDQKTWDRVKYNYHHRNDVRKIERAIALAGGYSA